MLNNLKTQIHQSIEELFATAAVDELAGDVDDYYAKLKKIVEVAEILGISTEVSIVKLNLKNEV